MKNQTDDKPAMVYDSLAGDYESWIDDSAGLKIVYNAFFETIRNYEGRLKGDILDLGCGTGIFTRLLSGVDGVRKVVGLDISRESVTKAKERSDSRCSFLAGSATCLPFSNASFDAVIAFGDTISHIFEGYGDAISEIGRVIKPGGHLLCDIDNKWNLGLLSDFREFMAAVKKPLSGHLREWSFLDSFGNECSLHFKTFLPSEMKNFLGNAGFSIIDYRGLIILPNLIPQKYHYNYPPERFLGRATLALSRIDRGIDRLPVFRGFGIGALVVARRNG